MRTINMIFIKKIERYFKRQKMKKLFSHYFSFDICDEITLINFAMFKDFYENGELELVNWNSDNQHKKAKQNMDKIYFYINYIKPKYEKIKDDLLNKIDFNVTITPTIHEGKNCYSYKSNMNNYNEKMFKVYKNIEDFLNKKDKFYLKLIIDIKDYLWT